MNRPVNYTDFFPTAQARYEIVPSTLQVRPEYSTAIGRPAFNQVTAATVIDRGNLTITTGNRDLFQREELTNAPWRIYEGEANRPIQREYYDITYEAGMKFKF